MELTDLVVFSPFDKKVAARIVLVGMLLQNVVEPFVARRLHFLEKLVRDWQGCFTAKCPVMSHIPGSIGAFNARWTSVSRNSRCRCRGTLRPPELFSCLRGS